MSISPRVEPGSNVLNWKSRLTLGLNAAESTDYMKKKLQIEVVENSIS